MSLEPSEALRLLPASPLPGFPDVLVGTQEDGADVLLGENTLQVAAVVNCALDDWLYKVRNGYCGSAAACRLPEIEASIRALPQSESIALGDISGIRYCALPARDRDRAEPIIIDGEVAVPGMEPYDMGQHLPAAVAFLQEQVAAGRRVLIHCLRGENPMADAATRKRKLQELEDKLGKFEETLKGHGSRPDMVELRFEESQQYRFLRNENSPARVMSKVVRWNARPSEHPQHCFHDAPMDMSEAGEEVLQAKASEISGGKRALPTKKASFKYIRTEVPKQGPRAKATLKVKGKDQDEAKGTGCETVSRCLSLESDVAADYYGVHRVFLFAIIIDAAILNATDWLVGCLASLRRRFEWEGAYLTGVFGLVWVKRWLLDLFFNVWLWFSEVAEGLDIADFIVPVLPSQLVWLVLKGVFMPLLAGVALTMWRVMVLANLLVVGDALQQVVLQKAGRPKRSRTCLHGILHVARQTLGDEVKGRGKGIRQDGIDPAGTGEGLLLEALKALILCVVEDEWLQVTRKKKKPKPSVEPATECAGCASSACSVAAGWQAEEAPGRST
ncbi:unnamed protein product [Symbiodinium microadriaticum]|nr:unnamed protein product [Symbiodinium microadriaticum]CAE7576361.1 unnamed protein product [Symbiodinium sp. KB8]